MRERQRILTGLRSSNKKWFNHL